MDWLKLAEAAGFEAVCELNMEGLQVRPEVREMCSADRCRSYGHNWACPPACGSLERCEARIASYSRGILVQTVGSLNGSFDAVGIEEAGQIHGRRFRTLIRQAGADGGKSLLLGAGPCTRCSVCTYPERPCRYPGKAVSSMEAYGLLVSQVCEASGLPYYRGEDHITFTSCVLCYEEDKR